jgi:phosphatidate cytidylyltransferase
MAYDDDDRVPDDGVRIIGADEAAERIGSDDVAHRRRDDEPRFGDRPEQPAERDTRPTIRFPLAADEVPRSAAAASQPFVASDDTAMPHWTEPPTGEVPRIFAAEDLGDDEGGTWSGFSSGQPRWRGEGPERHDDYDDFSRLADDETRVGAMASDDRPDPEDFFAFDEDVWDDEPEPARVGAADEGYAGYDDELDEGPVRAGGTRAISSDPRRVGQARAYERPAGAGRDMPTAVAVGLGFAAVALICFKVGAVATVALICVVLAVAAVELLNVLRQAGYQPAILLGAASCVALPIAAYHHGEAGIAATLFLTVVFGMIWYLAGAGGEDRPVIGLSSTLLGVAWVGLLGSFAALIVALPTTKDDIGSPGIGVLLVALVGTFAYDTGGLLVGRNAGTRPLSAASPNKTLEGLVGGMVFAVVFAAGAAVLIKPFAELDFMAALLVGLAVAVAAPLGDLCQSLIKRDLDVKDMGTILPGHGGFLDRFDGLLFVLPVVYYLARILLY